MSGVEASAPQRSHAGYETLGPLLALLCLLLLDRWQSSSQLLLVALPGFYLAVGLASYWGGRFSGLLTAGLVMGYLAWHWDLYQRIFHSPWIAVAVGGTALVSAWISAPASERRSGQPAGPRPTPPSRPGSFSEPLSEAALRELAALEWHRWRRYHAPFSMVWIELEDWSAIESAHAKAGAALLTQFIKGLFRMLRNTDVIGAGRPGRFLLLLPHTDHRGGMPVALKLRNLLHSLPGPRGPLTAFIATSSVHADDAAVDFILERGEEALTSARRQGSDSIVSAEPRPLSILPPPI